MPITLDRLPFDLLFYISSYLPFDDTLSLAHTCQQLKALLHWHTLCWRAIETHFPHTKEARLAQKQNITYSYCDAVQNIHDRRHAFSTAQPFSAQIVGQGHEYLYRDGALCILKDNIIRALDADTLAEICRIDLSSIEPKVSLLSFNDDIITVYHKKHGRRYKSRMLALSTKQEHPGECRLLKEIPLNSTYKLFARHTADCIYYGTYSGEDDLGHTEWEIRGLALSDKYNISPCAPLQLEKFFGTDIGSTIAFEIHNDHFYAVSNQTSFEVEEIDWTSFYHCIRFPLGKPTSKAMDVHKTVYRRQHNEGPMHDTWTDITLQFDEATDKTMIVEARREWQASTGSKPRTFYITEFEWEKKRLSPSEDGSPVVEASDVPLLPEDNTLTHLVDSSNNPDYAPKKHRPSWTFHPEIASECGRTRSFILARTKFKGYNYSCSSFFDLVEDERCCSESSTVPCLRIRVGTRHEAPLDWKAPAQDAPDQKVASSSNQEHDVVYRHPPVKMWPLPSSNCACSKRLHKILNPALPDPAQGRSITGVLDERRFIYIVRPGRPDNALGTIVMISFIRTAATSKPNGAGSTHRWAGMGGQFNPSRWDWTPGSCRKGTCH